MSVDNEMAGMTTVVMTRDRRTVFDGRLASSLNSAETNDDPTAIFFTPEGKEFLRKKLNASWEESKKLGYKWSTLDEVDAEMRKLIAETHKKFGIK